MSAILFGSIGTLVETSEVQRSAFNQAFEQHGLKWHWSQEEYQSLLRFSGGRHRIQAYADSQGHEVDAAQIHRSKSRIFQESLRGGELKLRPGICSAIGWAKQAGWKIAFVTTTSRENVDSLLGSVAKALDRSDLDVIVDVTQVSAPKPSAECFGLALSQLEESAQDCVAIEDNVDGVASAKAAGLICIAYPGMNTVDHDYSAADVRTDRLTISLIEGTAPAAAAAMELRGS